MDIIFVAVTYTLTYLGNDKHDDDNVDGHVADNDGACDYSGCLLLLATYI